MRKRLIIALASLGVAVLASFVFTDKFLCSSRAAHRRVVAGAVDRGHRKRGRFHAHLAAGWVHPGFSGDLLPGLDIHLPALSPSEKRSVYLAIPLATLFFVGESILHSG